MNSNVEKLEMKSGVETGMISKASQTVHPPFFVSLFNLFVHSLLRLGLPMGPMTLLTVRGRKTGKPHTNPVALFEHDGRRYLLSPFGQVNWVRNLRVAGKVSLRHGRHKEMVVAVEFAPEEAAPILKEAIAQYLPTRMGVMILRPNFDVEPDSPLTDFINEAKRHPVFELRESPSR